MKKVSTVMPTAKAQPLPPQDQHARIALTSRPKSAAPVSGVQRRHWNPRPVELFPSEPKKPSMRRPLSAAKPPMASSGITRPAPPPPMAAATAAVVDVYEPTTIRKASSPRATALVSQVTALRRATTQQQPTRLPSSAENGGGGSPPKPVHRSSVVAEAQIDAISRGSPKRLSTVTWTRLHKASEEQTAEQDPLDGRHGRKKQQTQGQQLEAAAASRRDAVRSAQVKRTLTKQDVEADDIRPLIEIAYWSPFLEVRRDAAAALASLSRNPANLEILSEVGTLGALISMLSAGETKVDPSIARDCAQTLTSMAKLDTVKLKILHAPEGLECVFALLHSPDLRLRCIAFELVNNLLSIEELRQAVAKREGFAFLLESCTSKDSRIRCLAAAILHHLAESHENRFLFYHANHFESLAEILHDPFMEKDATFRRELLGFIHLLVAEEENGRKCVELNLVPTLLSILDSPKATHQICVLVVSIMEALATNRKNHVALVAANALPRIVQLCFCSSRGLTTLEKRAGPSSSVRRPQSAIAASGSASGSTSAASARGTRGLDEEATCQLPVTASPPSSSSGSANPTPVLISSEVTALLRPAFSIFCEMAKNAVNREHVIRSKLVDYITARNLYAASDKRVRRGVITLLTFLVCKERERERDRDRRATTAAIRLDHQANEAAPAATKASNEPLFPSTTSATTTTTTTGTGTTRLRAVPETDFKHYIELLARGIIKCLFGILSGNDFSMKVDAIAAIAQLTEDEHSRLTMCKPQLLKSLKEFAFHPLIQTRTNIAKIIANFAERPENILKLVDEGMLAILVKYVCPISRNNDVLVEATRAIAAMSMVHVTRNRLVESGVLGTLLQFSKSPSTSSEVHAFATTAIRNLRHDAAALCIQAIYRGWCVRVHHARSILTRKRRVRKMTSIRKINTDQAFVSVMERFAGAASAIVQE